MVTQCEAKQSALSQVSKFKILQVLVALCSSLHTARYSPLQVDLGNLCTVLYKPCMHPCLVQQSMGQPLVQSMSCPLQTIPGANAKQTTEHGEQFVD